jgi:Nuclease-related domain
MRVESLCYCLIMSDTPEPEKLSELDLGHAGASAKREHERRKTNRENRVREKHPHLGGIILALQEDPQHERVWARGAGGEEITAQELKKYCSDSVVVLHDRRIPKSRANIDHIAVTANGIWVIDTKRYKGKVQVSNSWFSEPKLLIGGRNQTKLILALHKQVDLVKNALSDEWKEVPVHGAVSFVGDGLPLFGKIVFNGCPIVNPKQLSKKLNAPGPYSDEAILLLASALVSAFPAA